MTLRQLLEQKVVCLRKLHRRAVLSLQAQPTRDRMIEEAALLDAVELLEEKLKKMVEPS